MFVIWSGVTHWCVQLRLYVLALAPTALHWEQDKAQPTPDSMNRALGIEENKGHWLS